MKHHIFENNEENQVMLTHADQEAIIALAKQSNCGSFKQAVEMYAAENEELAHGIFENYDVLFPEYELLRKGEPETLEKYDQTWVEPALAKIHKSSAVFVHVTQMLVSQSLRLRVTRTRVIRRHS